MKRKNLYIAMCLILFLLVGCSEGGNQGSKQYIKPSMDKPYDLSVSCGTRSEEFFNKYYGRGVEEGKDYTTITLYQNHYNQRLNSCFILITSKLYPLYNPEKGCIHQKKQLLDVNENKTLGNCDSDNNGSAASPEVCVLLGKNYKTEKDWDLMTKPYMED